jgi:hypothetical protein
MGYAAYVIYDIWKRSLLPPIGRRRTLFLLRLVFLYFAIWGPYLILSLIGNFTAMPSWVLWSGAAVSHLQGALSVLFCTTDPDIKEAIMEFVCCKQKIVQRENDASVGGSSSSLLSFLSKSAEMMARWGSLQTSTLKILASSIVVGESQYVDCEEEFRHNRHICC